MFKRCIMLLIAMVSLDGYTQSVYAPLSDYQHHSLDRLELKNGVINANLHTSFKPYLREEVVTSCHANANNILNKRDSLNQQYLLRDNPEWSQLYDSVPRLFKSFYTQRNAFYHVKEDEFELYINPVLGFMGGAQYPSTNILYQNTRGVEIRGQLAKRIGFYSMICDNQAVFPEYINQNVYRDGVLEGAGLIKPFKKNGFDFFTSKGYFTYKPIKIMNVQFGHDRNFIGNGFRSLIWSDNSREYLFLKIQTKVWKFQYTNLFSEMSDLTRISGSGVGISKKYAALHHLSMNLGKKLNIGLFETVIFARKDGTGFETNYLNPIIFYRSIEHNLNSSDNVLVGLDFKYIPVKKVCLYGQVLLDEFVKKELIKRTGWWANKWAIQGGLKYIDVFGLKNFDVQLEFNTARPYTYTHFNRSQNYIHYNQAIAHPLGANFKEGIFILRYQPFYRLNTRISLIYSQQGLDTSSTSMSFGGNILRDYNSRIKDYNNTIGQGRNMTVLFTEFLVTYQAWHNVFIDIKGIYRMSKSEFVRNEVVAQLGLRVNLFGGTPYEFKY